MYKIAMGQETLVGDFIVDTAEKALGTGIKGTAKGIKWITAPTKRGINIAALMLAAMPALPIAYAITSSSQSTMNKFRDYTSPKYYPGYI